MSKRGRQAGAEEGVASPPRADDLQQMARRHLRFGWWALLIYLALGLALELMHGFKLGYYLEAATRRHMWTLAHAHGTLLALVHVAFALSLGHLESHDARWRYIASPCLYGATLTLPAGFFLGGCFIYSGDPGFGILLVPVGALLLMIAVWLIALGVTRR